LRQARRRMAGQHAPRQQGCMSDAPASFGLVPGNPIATQLPFIEGSGAARLTNVINIGPFGSFRARERPTAVRKKVERRTCKSVKQEENQEKGPRWSWARNQMGNRRLNECTCDSPGPRCAKEVVSCCRS
jgi:hypothetical protein